MDNINFACRSPLEFDMLFMLRRDLHILTVENPGLESIFNSMFNIIRNARPFFE